MIQRNLRHTCLPATHLTKIVFKDSVKIWGIETKRNKTEQKKTRFQTLPVTIKDEFKMTRRLIDKI
jgi:hypothetical protein